MTHDSRTSPDHPLNFRPILQWSRLVRAQLCCLTAVVCFLTFPVTVRSQSTINSQVTITTNPPGAEIELVGNTSVTGISPTTFRYPLAGSYNVIIRRPGYENYSSRILIDPATPFSMNVDLSRKTGFKAAARSLFLPGWGQQYMGERTKGLIFHTLAVASVGAFLLADSDFRVRRDRLELSNTALSRAEKNGVSADELSVLRDRVTVDNQEGYDAETRRWATAGAVAAVWGISVLDALLFSPVERATYGTPVSPTEPGLSLNIGPAGTSSLAAATTPALQLTWRW